MATLQDLRDQVTDIMQRDDYTTATLDRFISSALERSSQVLTVLQAETTATWNSSSPTLPADYAKMRSVWQDWSGRQVELKPLSPIEAAKWTETTSGRSLGYIITGDQMTIYPASTADCTIVYWRKPAALTTGTDTNYLTEDYPRIVLYGAAVEAALWERDMQSKDVFEAEYVSAVTTANEEAERARYGGGLVAGSNYQARTGITRGM